MPPDRPGEGADEGADERRDPGGSTVLLTEADAADLDRVEALLAANDLPTSDVRTGPGRFYLARDGDGDAVVGAGGVERYGSDGLLRSVVVERSSRGDGYGTALCAALEDRARRESIETLYLLTTTAAGFFERLGYEPLSREHVPASVRSTTEFADLCPSSATCMRKRVWERATE
ncbi:arsenic resistance N-acetyltransferase ArsN2 [Halobaculum magnesiiphilum]|uniref:Arsenic resistance N-acetyltransferase ArsN2 n=1 Tax=Halobaculum magnesiiphilum TaxID=1017351 RepID=A0A8T8W949_9EURY|nr:arsenic resistance N-acetyltransferase ArsN2 [Halobaculum magnesiiphilum]QZP36357.1 arsenic resistance N-acetyltransferase ArsN2 [Halobaculum magnesiiphilum]